ncbi:MAG TPA: 23S rRNA (pseudouridine(1915)-N(3))-methyltransferase RlmH [Clostridia bacterium]
MRILIRAVGKIRETWIKDGIAEFRKRLSRYSTVEIDEVEDSPDSLTIERVLFDEGGRLLAHIKPTEYVVLLDLAGSKLDSTGFASKLSEWMEHGGASVTFVIGGSNGVSSEVSIRANARFCLSDLTFTHAMARLILLEQLYRGFRILSGEPYHK